MEITPRQAFNMTIQFQLRKAASEHGLDLDAQQIELLASQFEDDEMFNDKLSDFLVGFIEDYGDNYGI